VSLYTIIMNIRKTVGSRPHLFKILSVIVIFLLVIFSGVYISKSEYVKYFASDEQCNSNQIRICENQKKEIDYSTCLCSASLDTSTCTGQCSNQGEQISCEGYSWCCKGANWVKGPCSSTTNSPPEDTSAQTGTLPNAEPTCGPPPPELKKGKTSKESKKNSSKKCNDYGCSNIAQGKLWGINNCDSSDPDGDMQLCDAKGRIGQCGGKKLCCPESGQKWTLDMTACPVTEAILIASPSAILAGQQLTVTWSSIPAPSATDWLAMYKQGETDERSPIEWNFTNSINTCTQTQGDGKAAGSCTFSVPATAESGTYELRLYSNNTYSKLATSNLITVTGTLTPTPLISPLPSGVCCACPTPTPLYTQSMCNGPCMTSFNCSSGQVCLLASSYGWVCRNPACPPAASCSCTDISPSPTPISIKLACDEPCSATSQCRSGYKCVYLTNQDISVCRNSKCFTSQTCNCLSVTPTGISKGTDIVSPTPISSTSGTPTPTGLRLNAVPTPIPSPTPAPINPSLSVKPFTDSKGVAPQKFTLTGTSDPFTEIDVRFDPDSLGQTTTADAKGDWRYIVTKQLTTGNKELTVTARSSDGGETQVKQSFSVKSGSSFPSLFLGFLFLAIIGGVGYFIYQKQMNDQSSLLSQFPPITPSPEGSETPLASDQTSGPTPSESDTTSPEPFIAPNTEISPSEESAVIPETKDKDEKTEEPAPPFS
jgi:uncharacterized protein YneF (UPF0154 family)